MIKAEETEQDRRVESLRKYTEQYMKEAKNNPKELEYWRNVFPNKSDFELEKYRVRWSKENPKYLKFNRL